MGRGSLSFNVIIAEDNSAVRMKGPMSVEGERVYKRYSKEFKLAAVRRMESCGNIAALAAELGIGRRFLYKWRDQLRTLGEEALDRGPGEGRRQPKSATTPQKQIGRQRRNRQIR
jgi:transposase-like protein